MPYRAEVRVVTWEASLADINSPMFSYCVTLTLHIADSVPKLLRLVNTSTIRSDLLTDPALLWFDSTLSLLEVHDPFFASFALTM